MQILRATGGDAVAVLEAAELAVAEMALLHYLSDPGAECATMADMMRELLFARVEAELREEEAARGAGGGEGNRPFPAGG